MKNGFNRFLRIFVMLALVVAPLRGLLASPFDAGMNQMQDITLSAVDMDETMQMDAGGSMGDCEQCCEKCSCEQSCYTCVHFTLAIPGKGFSAGSQRQSSKITARFIRPLERSILPLLQPPISRRI